MLLNKENSVLVLIDIQERITPATKEPRVVINGAAKLAISAKKIGVPVIVSEQAPQNLGDTMVDIRQILPKENTKKTCTYIEKSTFSCAKEPSFTKEIKKLKRKQVVIAGVEAHVCVMQTAIDMQEQGYNVYVVKNACSSRYSDDFDTAIERMSKAGIDIITVEMAIFEWLERCDTNEFKQLSRSIIK